MAGNDDSIGMIEVDSWEGWDGWVGMVIDGWEGWDDWGGWVGVYELDGLKELFGD